MREGSTSVLIHKQEHLVVPTDTCYGLAIALLGAAETCSRIRHASPAERAKPTFMREMEKLLTETQTRMIAEILPARSKH